jgi:maltose O-acetyltransferase
MELGLGGLSVFLAMPAYGDVPAETMKSMVATWQELALHGVPVEISIQSGSSRVTAARNIAAHQFLESDKNRFLQIDSDMVWDPRDVLKLLALSSEYECVGATYPMRQEPPTYCVMGIPPGEDVESNTFDLLSVEGFGLGFTVVQRKVMEELAAKAPQMVMADAAATVAAEIYTSGGKTRERDGVYYDTGEDMRFFADIKALGYKVWMDPTIRLGHVGQKIYWGAFADIIKESNMPKDYRAGKGLEWTSLYNNSALSEREMILRDKLGQIGMNVCVRVPFYCELGENIHLGDNVFINSNCTLSDVDSIIIGSRTLLGPGVQIYTGYHDKGRQQAAQTLCKPVVIGERCWIGGAAIILPGVNIGEGATVGAGSVVTKDVPAETTVAGNPARPIGENDNGPSS